MPIGIFSAANAICLPPRHDPTAAPKAVAATTSVMSAVLAIAATSRSFRHCSATPAGARRIRFKNATSTIIHLARSEA
jgi:hypothetical protein